MTWLLVVELQTGNYLVSRSYFEIRSRALLYTSLRILVYADEKIYSVVLAGIKQFAVELSGKLSEA